MKLLIAALLAVLSTSVMAEWTVVGGNDINTTYADLSTIRKSGDKVKMWSLTDYKVVKTSSDGTSYLSTKSLDEYDCKEETYKGLAYNKSSKNMGAGEVVYTSGNTHEEPRAIAPRSAGEALFKVACGK